jgi:hypothetical protein
MSMTRVTNDYRLKGIAVGLSLKLRKSNFEASMGLNQEVLKFEQHNFRGHQQRVSYITRDT